jgi:hypothetical protein
MKVALFCAYLELDAKSLKLDRDMPGIRNLACLPCLKLFRYMPPTISRPTPDQLLKFEEVLGSWSGVGAEMV